MVGSLDLKSQMRFQIPRLVVPAASLIYAGAFFYWLGLEDLDARLVTALGAGLALLAGLHGLRLRRAFGFSRRPWTGVPVLCGAALGLAVAPLTAILMAVKVSLHSHSSPDFEPGLVLAVLQSTPVWGLAGLLLGAAGSLLLRIFPENRN